jgi:hypothetical protein
MGKNKYIKTPEILAEHFKSYVEWVDSNPVLKEDYVGKDAERVDRRLKRPLSWVGFEVWLYKEGIISDLSDYEENKNGSYTEFLPIIRAIKKIIETDQFDGAVVGVYQQNIIARKLGLVEKREETQTVIRVVKPKE